MFELFKDLSGLSNLTGLIMARRLIIERTLTQTHPHVWRLVAPNPSPMTGPGTNTYLVGGPKVVIIDPGPADETHQQAIVAALQTLHAEAQAVVVTHSHPDHSEGAPTLAHRLNVPLLSLGSPLPHNDSLQIVLRPSTFDLEPSTLTILHTPGHTPDHLCLWWAEPRLLFAGDLVAGEGTVLIVPPDGDMAAYLDSLRAMLALSPQAILPGHGPVIEDAPALLQQYLDHRLQREQQVLALLAQGYTTAAAIAAQIYADRPEALAIATLQVEAHLEKLRKEGHFGSF
ncbi:MAG: MBL fold metallo-hydrolase [Anaerolineales bacterium]|nr:MBL fold metallo-hydrolase [Anaerolineales bacterium]